MKAYQVSILFYIPEIESWSALSVLFITNKGEDYIVSECKKEIRNNWLNPMEICVTVDEIDNEFIEAIKEM